MGVCQSLKENWWLLGGLRLIRISSERVDFVHRLVSSGLPKEPWSMPTLHSLNREFIFHSVRTVCEGQSRLLRRFLQRLRILERNESMASVFPVGILLREQRAWKALVICHGSVDRGTGQRHRLTMIDRQTHVEVLLAPVNMLMAGGCRHAVIVCIGTLLVPRKCELFLVNRIGLLEVLSSDPELIYGMLIVCLEEFGPSHAQMSMWSRLWSSLQRFLVLSLGVGRPHGHRNRRRRLVSCGQLLLKAVWEHLWHCLVLPDKLWSLHFGRSCGRPGG